MQIVKGKWRAGSKTMTKNKKGVIRALAEDWKKSFDKASFTDAHLITK